MRASRRGSRLAWRTPPRSARPTWWWVEMSLANRRPRPQAYAGATRGSSAYATPTCARCACFTRAAQPASHLSSRSCGPCALHASVRPIGECAVRACGCEVYSGAGLRGARGRGRARTDASRARDASPRGRMRSPRGAAGAVRCRARAHVIRAGPEAVWAPRRWRVRVAGRTQDS